MKKVIFSVFCLLISCAHFSFAEDPLNTWHTRAISGPIVNGSYSDNFNAAVYGNNTFLIKDDVGQIYTSQDGITWTISVSVYPGNSSPMANVNHIIYANGMFVAPYGSTIFISSDGTNWTAHSTIHAVRITYGNNIFAGIDWSGIATSSNGTNWTERINRPTGLFAGGFAIAYGSNMFVAIMDSSTVSISSNGADWTQKTLQIEGADYKTPGDPSNGTVDYTFGDMIYGNGIFLVTAQGGLNNGVIFSSLDGIKWTKRLSANYFNAITFGKNIFTAVTDYGSIFTSADGIKWVTRNSGTTFHLNDIAYGNNTFVAVGKGPAIRQSDALVPVVHDTPIGNIDITSAGSSDRIDGQDLYLLSKSFGSALGGPKWNSSIDLDDNFL
ncbi:MAG: hypothetical protein PHX78_07285 [bacterium]|nr:hypothetical protein [bacterium]